VAVNSIGAISVERRRSTLASKPMILWPTAIGYGDVHGSTDSKRFPTFPAIKARKSARLPAPLEAFVQAAKDAQDRLFVLDDFLFKPQGDGPLQPRIDQVLNWFQPMFRASNVRLLTNAIGSKADRADIVDQLERCAEIINAANPYRPRSLVIDVRFTLGKNFPYVHDRFAIIDDELWHFGATVGGFHHAVNAATRGWHVDDHDAVTFFEIAWEQSNGRQRISA